MTDGTGLRGPDRAGDHPELLELGPYLLGGLDPAEAAAVETHLATCDLCRRELEELRGVQDLLGDLPPEALLEGPPEGGDLIVQRAIRQARAESAAAVEPAAAARSHRGRNRLLGAAAAVVLLGAGAVIGQQFGGTQAPAPPVTAGPVAGSYTIAGTDATTGASIKANVTPAAGWVRFSAQVAGIPAGQRCRVIVVGADGSERVAGSWLVSPAGAAKGTKLDSFALIAPADVRAIRVENFAGKEFVNANRA